MKTMMISTTRSNTRTIGVATIQPSPGNAKELVPFIHKPSRIMKRIKITIEIITEIASSANKR